MAVKQGEPVIARTLDRFRRARDFLIGNLQQIPGVRVANPSGTMYAFFGIDGMSCGGCVNAVRSVLSRAPGVATAEVKIGEAKVTFDEAATGEAELRAAIENAGYAARA